MQFLNYKLTFIISYITLIMAFSIGIYFCYLLFYPITPFTFVEEPHLIKLNYRAGDYLEWSVHIIQNTTGLSVTVSKQIIDGYVINFPDSSYVTKKGEMKFINKTIRIPPQTPKGEYKLMITNKVEVNKFRNMIITKESQPFMVN